jgi:hypothetical protein
MKSPEPLRIRHLSVGVLGGVQPDKIAGILDGPDDGLVSRLLWTWPDRKPGFTLARGQHDDSGPRRAFTRLTELQMGFDEFGNPTPKRLRLEAPAEDCLEEFARDMEHRGADSCGVFAGSLGKARGHAVRLSLVLEHLWWCGEAPRPEPSVISLKAMEAAAAFVDGYFLPMAERVYGDAAIPAPERAAMTLARYLKRAGLREFNAREVRRHIGGSLRDAAPMEAACAALVEAGLLRAAFCRASGHGRPAHRYEVNPVVHGETGA